MIAVWMCYSILGTTILAAAAASAETLAHSMRRSSRFIPAAAMLAAGAFVSLALARGLVGDATSIHDGLSNAGPSRYQRLVNDAGRFDTGLLILWSMTSAALLVGFGTAALHMRRRRKAWRSAIMAGTPVLVSDNVGPLVLGLRDPVVVVPAWVANRPAHEQTLIVAHERQHIAARDSVIMRVGLALVTLAPWNVALWFLLRRLRRCIEADCDLRVLARHPDAASYARVLLNAAARADRPLIAAPAFSPPLTDVEFRITQVVSPPVAPRRRAIALHLAVATALPGILLLAPAPRIRTSAGLRNPRGTVGFAILNPAGATRERAALSQSHAGF